MALWTFTFIALFFSVRELRPILRQITDYLGEKKTLERYRAASKHMRLLQEMLEAGLAPESGQWEKILEFPKPWGLCIHSSLAELRGQGAAVMPTLARAEHTLNEQAELLQEGRVKSSQAMGQAILSITLVPFFAVIVYFMLPEIQEAFSAFLLIVFFALFLGLLAFFWLLLMIENARYGNLEKAKRPWFIFSSVSLERLNALISTGMPGDLAWKKMAEETAAQDPALIRFWKSSVWDQDAKKPDCKNECERLILQLGTEVRRGIQTSLMEGRPCLERIESIHRNFMLDLKLAIGRELSLLPNRCLKPLFVFVFPSVLFVLFGSLALCFEKFIS